MYKKISKTIILVVFLAFFGIMKVNADERYICQYDLYEKGKNCSGKICGSDSTDTTQLVTILSNGKAVFDTETSGNSGFSELISDDGQYNTSGIQNWESSYAGFSGSEYFEKNKEKCPPYLVVNWECTGDSKVFFADKDSLSDIKKKTFTCSISPVCDDCEKNEYNGFKLVNQIKVEKEKKESQSNTSKSCKPKQKSEKNYSDPTVVPNKPLENDFSTYSCGEKLLTGIPISLPKFTKFIYNFIQFLVPLILIILGTIDLIRSIVGGKEDEIKKGQQIFIKRLISGALVFFALSFVKLLVSVVFVDSSRVSKCLNCFVVSGTHCDKESDTYEFTYSNSQSNECEEG